MTDKNTIIPAAAQAAHHERCVDTLAGSGANNSGSHASDVSVGVSLTSAEGVAVVEPPKPDETPAEAGHDVIEAAVDMVNHPPHYQGKVECIDAIEAALGPVGFAAYCRGNAIKYLFRAGRKGDYQEDLAKAAWYLARAKGCAA